jgi:hypothetical protein
MIRRVARAIASIGIIIGWLIAGVWLALSVSQIAVGRVSLQSCTSNYPLAATLTAPEFYRVLNQEMARC